MSNATNVLGVSLTTEAPCEFCKDEGRLCRLTRLKLGVYPPEENTEARMHEVCQPCALAALLVRVSHVHARDPSEAHRRLLDLCGKMNDPDWISATWMQM